MNRIPIALQAPVILACFLAPHAALGQNTQYTVTILQPSNGFDSSEANGISGNSQVGYGIGSATSGNEHALLWSGSANSYVDLNPAGFSSSAGGISGNYQVGTVFDLNDPSGNTYYAALWNGSAASFQNLNPVGFTTSYGTAISGNAEVGAGTGSATGGNLDALLWHGSASSYVDLSPPGFTDSVADAVSGNIQVGFGIGAETGQANHALLWQGTAASFVDLNPATFDGSLAVGVSGNTEAGYGSLNGFTHALLWQGTAASFVDLNPAGFDSSTATAVANGTEVGFAYNVSGPGSNTFAGLWNGSAGSFVDLHSFLTGLPQGFVGSQALGVDRNGDVVGYGYTDTGSSYAVLWTPVPEPASVVLFAVGASCLCVVVRRRSKVREEIKNSPSRAVDRLGPAARDCAGRVY